MVRATLFAMTRTDGALIETEGTGYPALVTSANSQKLIGIDHDGFF
jgi:hypothetical protein